MFDSERARAINAVKVAKENDALARRKLAEALLPGQSKANLQKLSGDVKRAREELLVVSKAARMVGVGD